MTFGLFTHMAPRGSLEHIHICVPSNQPRKVTTGPLIIRFFTRLIRRDLFPNKKFINGLILVDPQFKQIVYIISVWIQHPFFIVFPQYTNKQHTPLSYNFVVHKDRMKPSKTYNIEIKTVTRVFITLEPQQDK